jgi:hypothetical protein
MDLAQEQSELDEMLRGEGLPLKALKFERRRAQSNVWSGELAGPMGDAKLRMLVYALDEHPEQISDFESDKAALWAMQSLGSRLEGELVCDFHGERLAVIVVADEDDARIAVAVRTHLLADPEEGIWTSYHPQLDRILNATWTRRVGTGWAKSSLMDAARAMALHEATERLREAIGTLPEDAVPTTLAIVQPEVIPVMVGSEERELTVAELLAMRTMAMAPSRYHSLAEYVAVIADPHTVDDPLVAETARQDLSGFSALLLAVTAGAHREAKATFTTGIGCCLRPEFVTARGQLTDLYFLRLIDDLDAISRSRLQVGDVLNALDVVLFVAARPSAQLGDALLAAAAAYLGRDLSRPLADMVRDVALDPAPDPRNRRIAALAGELRRALG